MGSIPARIESLCIEHNHLIRTGIKLVTATIEMGESDICCTYIHEYSTSPKTFLTNEVMITTCK